MKLLLLLAILLLVVLLESVHSLPIHFGGIEESS